MNNKKFCRKVKGHLNFDVWKNESLIFFKRCSIETLPISVTSFLSKVSIKKVMAKKTQKVSLFVNRIKCYFRINFCHKVVFQFLKGNLFTPVLIGINKRTNFCIVMHAQTNFAQAKYFMPKAICLPIGPMMSFQLFPLVWNARSKQACSSGECFPRQSPNMDHIWGLLGAPNRPFPSLPGYLHLRFRC